MKPMRQAGFLLSALFVTTAAYSQQVTPAAKRLSLNFSPGFFTSGKTVVYGAGAEAEFYSTGSVSTRTDLYCYAGQQKEGVLRQSYQLMIGLVYNFNRGASLSYFAGFQPGIGIASAEMTTGGISALKPYPILSPLFGMHWFFTKHAHVTFSVRYVFGELSTADTGAVYLSEVRGGVALGCLF